MINKRNDTIDLLKGIAILCVVWGHTIQYATGNDGNFFDDIGYLYINSFHMPLFMLLSGYLFYKSWSRECSFEKLFERVKNLMIPIFMCGIVPSIVVQMLLGHTIKMNTIYHGLTSTLWFLWSLICMTLVYGMLDIVAKKFSVNLIIKWMLEIIGGGILIALPNGQVNLWLYPFFLMGCCVSKENLKFQPNIVVKFIVPIIWGILGVLYKTNYYISYSGMFLLNDLSNQLYIDIYRWTFNILGVVTIIIVSQFFKKRLLLFKSFVKIGQYTLQIYIIQHWLLEVVIGTWMVPRIIDEFGWTFVSINTVVFDCLIAPIFSIIYCLLCIMIVRYLEKIKIAKLLFGR